MGASLRYGCVSTPFIEVSSHESFFAYVTTRMAAVYWLFSIDGKLLISWRGTESKIICDEAAEMRGTHCAANAMLGRLQLSPP